MDKPDRLSERALSDLSAHLQQELLALKAFIGLLEQEQQALLESDSDRVTVLAEQKAQAAHQLTQLIQLRRQTLPLESIPDWLAEHAPALSSLWQQIADIGRQAHQVNQVNGEVIQLKLRSNTLALNALLNAGKTGGALYGRNGQQNLALGGRILGNG